MSAEKEVLEARAIAQSQKARREALMEERRAKEEELLIRQIDKKLLKAFDKDYEEADAEAAASFLGAFGADKKEIDDILKKLSPESVANLRAIISKNPSGAGAFAYLSHMQQAQGKPFDMEYMLKFMEMVDKLANRSRSQASTVPMPPQPTELSDSVSSGTTQLLGMLIEQIQGQQTQMMGLYKDALTERQQAEMVIAKKEVQDLKSIVNNAITNQNQPQGMKEWLRDLKEGFDLLQGFQPQQPQNLEIAKLNVDWEREKEKLKHEATIHAEDAKKGVEMIKTIRETIQDGIEGLAKPIFEAHKDGVKEKIEDAKFKRAQILKNGNFSTTPSGQIIIHPPTPDNSLEMEGQLEAMPTEKKEGIRPKNNNQSQDFHFEEA